VTDVPVRMGMPWALSHMVALGDRRRDVLRRMLLVSLDCAAKRIRPPAKRGNAMTEPATKAPKKVAKTLNDNARLAIPLGIALVMGVFVSLGIEGELLSRLLRQHPNWVGGALVGAVVAVTAPLILAAIPAEQLERVTVLSALLLVVSTAVAVWAGIDSITIRERPNLDVTGIAADREKQTATVTVSASALSMASADSLLLRIATFGPDTSPGDALDI